MLEKRALVVVTTETRLLGFDSKKDREREREGEERGERRE